MGPGIVIPLVAVAVAVPFAWYLAKKHLKDAAGAHLDEPVVATGIRLTSRALRDLPSPTWRVVYEVAEDKLGGPSHVLVGPPGIFAVTTTMESLPTPPAPAPDPNVIAAAAIARGGLDDALRRCAMSSDQLLTVHWGAIADGAPSAIATAPGALAVDGRSLAAWAERAVREATTDPTRPPRSQAEIDLAWQTVTLAIGRPDPLG